MKKFVKIILAVLLAVLLLLGWFVYKNWNSISAVLHSFETTEEQTVQEIEQTKQELQNYINNEEDITVRDLTEEEAKALSSGELTEDEVVELLTGSTPAPEPTKKPTGNNKPSKTQTPATPKPTPDSDKIVSELIAKLYVQKSKYLNKLDAIEDEVMSEYLNNWKQWDSKKAAKQALLKKYLPRVSSWEKECDSVVYGILDEIRAELKKSGKDTSIVDTMKQSYLDEKKLKKTYFINRYMD